MNISDELLYKKQLYLYTTLMNELMAGQDLNYIVSVMKAANAHSTLLDMPAKFHICITGLDKPTYSLLGITVFDYVDIFFRIREDLYEYFTLYKLKFEIFLHVYGQKKIVFLLFVDEHSQVTAEDAAAYITEYIQRVYEREIFKGNKAYCNFTALSSELTEYSQIGAVFTKLLKLTKVHFFLNKPVVITEQKLIQMSNNISYNDVFAKLNVINTLITNGEVDNVIEQLEVLFLQDLKFSFNFSLCFDTIAELKKQAKRFNKIFDLKLDAQIDVLFVVRQHKDIEHLHKKIESILRTCVIAANDKGRGLSYISQEAIRYLKSNYHRQITLHDVASYVNVVSGYLSRVFNREVGCSAPKYLNTLRMEKAQELLLSSNMKVMEIAYAVGFENVRYFGQRFKKQFAMTPQEYRLANQQSLRNL